MVQMQYILVILHLVLVLGAANFTLEELKKAIDYAHIRNVKVHLALNILIKNEEFSDAISIASTQMTTNNLNGVKILENLGFKRVVLSRELSIREIEFICRNTNMEIETFIHGALCISYSGQCLLSSMIGGRSANRR